MKQWKEWSFFHTHSSNVHLGPLMMHNNWVDTVYKHFKKSGYSELWALLRLTELRVKWVCCDNVTNRENASITSHHKLLKSIEWIQSENLLHLWKYYVTFLLDANKWALFFCYWKRNANYWYLESTLKTKLIDNCSSISNQTWTPRWMLTDDHSDKTW